MGPPDTPPPRGSRVRYGDPWADPPSQRDPVRRARARLPAPVTVWTAGDADDRWAGLTVSSLLLAEGQPGRLVGLIGPDTDLAEYLEMDGTFVVHLLSDRADHRRLAQHFAGALPADAALLEVEASDHGPRLRAAAEQLACHVSALRACGWSRLVDAEIEAVRLGPPSRPLVWHRGEFWRWP